MKATEFVESLKVVAPDPKRLKEAGLTGEVGEKILSGYIATARSIYSKEYDDELLCLVQAYDLRTIEIGMITFNDRIVENENGYYLGKVELDLLFMNKQDGVIRVYEHGEKSHVLWNCASSGETFLDALLLSASFLTSTMFSESLYNDNEAILQVATDCAELAGGEDYLDFYRMLLGYF